MASPLPQGTIKKETISASLDNGKGTLLVIRPGKNGQQIGQLHQFDYEGNAALKLLDALAVARRQLEEKIAAAKTAPAVGAGLVPAQKRRPSSSIQTRGTPACAVVRRTAA